MDIFERVISVTDDLDKIVEVVCPQLRPPVYYMAKVFDPNWQYSSDYASSFLESLLSEQYAELSDSLESLFGLIQLDATETIEDTVKSILEYSYTFTFGETLSKLIGKFISRIVNLTKTSDQSNEIDKQKGQIFTTGKTILKICNGITDSRVYPDLSKVLKDKSAVRPFVFGILGIRKIVEGNLLKNNMSKSDIVRFCMIYWAAIMRYHLNNMHYEVWIPAITEFVAQNGGKYFRLCEIKTAREKESIPLFNVIFPKIALTQAVKPDWHSQLLGEIKSSEIISSFKGLHKLFLFHIIDQFITICGNSNFKSRGIEEIFATIRPYPDDNTIRRYFNLYLGTQIYTEKIDCGSWQPDTLLYNMFISRYSEYNDCLNALRDEYFPEHMFDLNALISAACEFYEDKFHLDLLLDKIDDSTMLDNISIWYTAEWIINNRKYPFIESLSCSELAEMFGSAITRH